MKLMNWNVEWMNRWFSSDSEGPPTFSAGSGITDIDALAARVAGVIRTVDPDILTLQEGPSRMEEMRLFADTHLAGAYEAIGPAGRGQQKLYALVKRGGAIETAHQLRGPEAGGIDLDEPWEIDVDGDYTLDDYEFTRGPLVLDIVVQGRRIRVISLHTKSKFVRGGAQEWRNPARRPAFIVKAVLNRRRISAEILRVREYLDEILEQDETARVIVTGDLNDGPGTDFFEKRYLSHNSVAQIAGHPFRPRLMLRHAFIDRVVRDDNYTAIFDDFVDDVRDRHVLLDHILVSPSLYWGGLVDSRIEHAAYEAAVDPKARTERQRQPSDHRPQSATFSF